MKAIMVMYDTLCRNFLEPYGNTWVKTPNFKRLAAHSVVFDTNYVCSLPCMPARRDLHNSRPNFLQRGWGPLEPYDDSMPEELKFHGIYSVLVSDHYHYWEDGGCTYHNRYNSWMANRGQEGDLWQSDKKIVDLCTADDSPMKDPIKRMTTVASVQDQVNRSHITEEEEMPQHKTFQEGLDFIENNHDSDKWFLQIETFDPHEPFFTQKHWKELYPDIAKYTGKKTDWPRYETVKPDETKTDIDYVRNLYAALVSMCDSYLGKVLDYMDKYDLWKDTMLIVNTDHGFLLGEHDWWGKSIMPPYEEISHTPLFIYDPVSKKQGERRKELTSPLDLPVTLLDFFNVPVPKDMQGHSLLPVIREDKQVRDADIFGFNAAHVVVTDGHYTYFRAPMADQENNCFEYTLMPTRMRWRFSVQDLQKADFVGPLPNSKGCKVLKTPPEGRYISPVNFGTKLFDVIKDPKQKNPIDDPKLEAEMANLLIAEMKKGDAPLEQFVRLGLKPEGGMTADDILASRQKEEQEEMPDVPGVDKWTKEAINAYRSLNLLMPKQFSLAIARILPTLASSHPDKPVTVEDLIMAVKKIVPPEQQPRVIYFIYTIARSE
jgi:arylsulfatase A-like enzyme